MAKAGRYWLLSSSSPSPTNQYWNTITNQASSESTSLYVCHRSHRRNEISLTAKRSQKPPRYLIKISTSDGKWHGKWNLDYNYSLQELHLQDLAEDGHKDAQVSINLSIQKHTGFGLSVDGRIITSLVRKCSICSSPYSREIDTNFNLWVLPSSKKRDSENELPEIGGDDPSVIYVKPGYEAELDVLIQDTIRLATSVKETCSESCEKSEPKFEHIGARNVASIDRRWARLLELRNGQA